MSVAQAKVADFGVFKHLQTGGTRDDQSLNTKVVGTPGYLDPEYYQTYKVTAKSDVYRYGYGYGCISHACMRSFRVEVSRSC